VVRFWRRAASCSTRSQTAERRQPGWRLADGPAARSFHPRLCHVPQILLRDVVGIPCRSSSRGPGPLVAAGGTGRVSAVPDVLYEATFAPRIDHALQRERRLRRRKWCWRRPIAAVAAIRTPRTGG
jgi:hypothetical protein